MQITVLSKNGFVVLQMDYSVPEGYMEYGEFGGCQESQELEERGTKAKVFQSPWQIVGGFSFGGVSSPNMPVTPGDAIGDTDAATHRTTAQELGSMFISVP